MATTDQNITELPIKTASEVSDADYLMGIDLVEGYQVSTKDFADYAVNHAEISIDGKTQTTASALNEVRTTASNAQPKESGKGLSTNDFTTAEKNKLSGIASGAEVNQNAFSNVKVGNTTIAADGKTDTLEIVAGSNISLTPDATNDKVTISGNYSNATTSASGLMSAEDKSKLNGIASGAEVNVQSDWNASSGDAAILHKPTTLAGYGVKSEVDSLFDEKGLVDVVKGSDSIPYHFRKTPYGYRLKEKIIGGTVAWNQLSESYLSTTMNGVAISHNNGVITFNGTNTIEEVRLTNLALEVIKNHVYLCTGAGLPNGSYVRYAMGAVNGLYSSDAYHATVFKGKETASNTAIYVSRASSGYEYNNVKFIPQVHDLTQMFGTAIADYIYTLEQTTAGAGVALFRELFPKDYYEYDAGSLQSVSGLQSHDEVGFNQWDEEWEVGDISNATGESASGNGRIRCKNYIPAIGGQSYCFYCKEGDKLCLYAYDSDKNFIGVWHTGSFNVGDSGATDIGQITVIALPSNCRYIKIKGAASYGAIYNHDICINISDPSKNGTYVPYKKHSYALDSSLTLRGVPKLVDNKIKFDGDVYESDGKVTRRYGVVDLGTLDWEKQLLSDNVHYNFRTAINNFKLIADSEIANIICSKYTPVSTLTISQVATITDKTISSRSNTIAGLRVYDSSYADAASFKTAMSGVMLVYELATPTEETAQPFTNPQRCAEGGTEEYVTTSIVPVGHESEYVSNKAERFDALPDTASLDGDYVIRQENGVMELVSLNDLLTILAPLENGTTASKAYTTGEYFMHNGQFCKAKTAIASGATFTLNTNYEVTTVGAELYTALHS